MAQVEKDMAEVTKRTAAKKAEKPAKPAKVQAEVKLHPCGCGCGEMVARRFKPGHDARHKGNQLRTIYSRDSKTTAKAVERAEKEMEKQGWTHKIDYKRANSAADARKGLVAGLKEGEEVGEGAVPSVDSARKPKKVAAKAPTKADTKGARAFDADDEDDDIEVVD